MQERPLSHYWTSPLKGKVSQTIMWIGWVEGNFWNPTVQFWKNFDNPFQRANYAKLCIPAISGKNSARNNSPLTKYTQIFTVVNFTWILLVWLIMHNHLRRNIPKFKWRGKIYFHEQYLCACVCVCVCVYSSLESNAVVTSQNVSRVPPEIAA